MNTWQMEVSGHVLPCNVGHFYSSDVLYVPGGKKNLNIII